MDYINIPVLDLIDEGKRVGKEHKSYLAYKGFDLMLKTAFHEYSEAEDKQRIDPIVVLNEELSIADDIVSNSFDLPVLEKLTSILKSKHINNSIPKDAALEFTAMLVDSLSDQCLDLALVYEKEIYEVDQFRPIKETGDNVIKVDFNKNK